MREFMEMLGWFAALFAGAAAFSWIATSFVLRARRRVDVIENCPVRIRAEGAVYRSRLLSAKKDYWSLAAPLQRDVHVPLHVGEKLTVDLPSPKGLLRFRTKIVERDSEEHLLRIEPPNPAFLIERRQSKRFVPSDPFPVRIEDLSGRLVDLSELGAKVVLHGQIAKGERVRVESPFMSSPLYAWVLESIPAGGRKGDGTVARLRFEELFDMKRVPKRRTPA